VLPGQFLSSPDLPSLTFLSNFQGLLAARSPLQTAHHVTPLPAELPEELLLSSFVLVRHDGVQPPLSPLYDGLFLVLERSLNFFKVQIGSRMDTVSTHRLKPCHAPQNVQAAKPPGRGHPPNAAKMSVSRQPMGHVRLPTGHLQIAASAARHQVRPPCSLYSQADALHRLRTNIPSCKNAEGGKWLTI
jgi:hypothetical protein